MKKIAVISAILEEPVKTQEEFNAIIASYKDLIRGRMGIPMPEEGITIITVTVFGDLDSINSLTGKLGRIQSTQIKTAISKKEF